MARKHYERTDETFKVLSKFETAIAREMECDVSYINKIKNNSEIDRFAFFREVFRAAAFADAPVEIWLNDLTAILTRAKQAHVGVSEISGLIVEKIQTNAETLSTILESVQDNHLDKSECHSILEKLKKSDATNEAIRQAVLKRLGELSAEDHKRVGNLREVK